MNITWIAVIGFSVAALFCAVQVARNLASLRSFEWIEYTVIWLIAAIFTAIGHVL